MYRLCNKEFNVIFKAAISRGDYKKVERILRDNLGDKHCTFDVFKYAIKSTNIIVVSKLLTCGQIGQQLNSKSLFDIIEVRNSDNKFAMIEYLIKFLGLNPNVTKANESILFSIKDLATLKWFVECGSDFRVRDVYGKNLLMCNIELIEIAKYLLNLGININDADDYGFTFLHYVFLKLKQKDLYKFFLTFASEKLLAKKNNRGRTPFVLFIQQGINDEELETFNYLLTTNIGIDFKVTDDDGKNAFYMFYDSYIFADDVTFSIIEKMLSSGIDPYHRDNLGNTMISYIPNDIKNIIESFYIDVVKEPDC